MIHKSVAEFVDRSAKVRATARTAFARKEGIFFRVTGTAPSGLKLFRPSYESRERWSDLESLGQAGENALLLLAEECLVSAGLRES